MKPVSTIESGASVDPLTKEVWSALYMFFQFSARPRYFSTSPVCPSPCAISAMQKSL